MNDNRQWHRPHTDLWNYRVPLGLLGLDIGRSGVVARYSENRWAFIGPVPLDPASRRAIDDAGRVDALIVQTAFHNAFVPEACDEFPDALVYLAKGAKTEDLPDDRIRRLDELPEAVTRSLIPFPLRYRIANEVLFFHAVSATLIVGDFCVHFPDDPPSLRARTLRRLLGWVPGPRMPTLLKLLLHRRSALSTFEHVCEQRPQRIVMSHGEPIENDIDTALQALRRGLGGSGRP